VLDILSPAELASAAARDDKAAVARASGVGPKLAQRIVTELKGKPLVGGLTLESGTGSAPAAPPRPSMAGEAVAALMGLGINEAQARRSVEAAQARLEPDPPLSALIKAALQEVGR
jgi:Holliday junction DNA helicase RuvA